MIDNEVYNQLADTWWDEDGVMNILKSALNPARMGYFREVISKLGLDPAGATALDVGCGGGLLAEEFARIGFAVTGVDPSLASLQAARAHAVEAQLDIKYRAGAGENLAFSDESFDTVYCCDVLEHVSDPDKVIAEISRVLKPGGVFMFDTLNRTFRSWLVAIKVFQEWRWTSFLPHDLHEWKMFIRPQELRSRMRERQMKLMEIVGISPAVGSLKIIAILRQKKKGLISYGDMGRKIRMRKSGNTSISYMGYAIKSPKDTGLSPVSKGAPMGR